MKAQFGVEYTQSAGDVARKTLGLNHAGQATGQQEREKGVFHGEDVKMAKATKGFCKAQLMVKIVRCNGHFFASPFSLPLLS